MELVERVSTDRLALLNRITIKEFAALTPKCKNDNDRQEYFKCFKHFLDVRLKCKGEMKVLYKYTDAADSGRLFAGNSLQGISAFIRGYLCNGESTDIDMTNAHPKILEYICKKHKLTCPNLLYYNRNRSECVDALGEDGKTLFLASVNDSKPKRSKNAFFRDFDKEMKRLQAELVLVDEYSWVKTAIPANKKHNFLGSYINRILCFYENKLLQKMVDKLTQLGLEIQALCFDGLMVYGSHYENADLLQMLEAELAEYDVKLKYKGHSDVLSESYLRTLPEAEETKLDELGTAQQIFKDYPHWKCCSGVLFVFDEETGQWSESDTLIHQIIIKYAKGSFGRTFAKREGVKRTLMTMCISGQWMADSQLCSKGFLLFNNGYYDGNTGTFFNKKDNAFNPDIVFFDKIEYDYDESIVDEKYLESIYHRLFGITLGEVGGYLLEQLARGLMGEQMKRILFCLGESNAGKSLLVKAVCQACGAYAGAFNAENLAYTKSTADEASQMRWIFKLKDKRLIFSNEMKTDTALNSNSIKKISSGGDTLIGRQHFKEETAFSFMGLATIFANDIPKMKPYDIALDNRVRVVSYTKPFVDNPQDETELQLDPNIENEIQTLRFKQGLIMLLLTAFRKFKLNGPMVEPEAVLQAKNDWIDEEPDNMKRFLTDYVVTNNPTDFVETSDIAEWIKENKIQFSATKLGMERAKYAKKHNLEHFSKVQRKINGKVVWCWTGIKKIEPTGI